MIVENHHKAFANSTSWSVLQKLQTKYPFIGNAANRFLNPDFGFAGLICQVESQIFFFSSTDLLFPSPAG